MTPETLPTMRARQEADLGLAMLKFERPELFQPKQKRIAKKKRKSPKVAPHIAARREIVGKHAKATTMCKADVARLLGVTYNQLISDLRALGVSWNQVEVRATA